MKEEEESKSNVFKNDRPSRTLYRKFLKRHPDITTSVSENLIFNRANVSEAGVRARYGDVDVC